MTPRGTLLTVPFLAALISVAFVYNVRLPFIFDGSVVVIAAVLAFVLCMTILAWLPAGWLWTDAEMLSHAFKSYHRLSDQGTNNALAAITETHARAADLRKLSVQFHKDLQSQVERAADQLDAGAREIFYQPSRLRALGPVLRRAELIEDATRAHKALRGRAKSDHATVALSRKKLAGALDALQSAFAQSDLAVARGHLEQVEIASSVAENLLSPRAPLSSLKDGYPQ